MGSNRPDGQVDARDGRVTVLARPLSLFTFEFEVVDGGQVIGGFRHRALRQSGEAEIGDVGYVISRQQLSRWILEQEGVPGEVARIERAGRLKNRFVVRWATEEVQLARAGWGYRMRMYRGGREVGWVRLRNLFSRALVAEFPPEMPPPVQVMVLWMVVRLRRQAAAAGGGGA